MPRGDEVEITSAAVAVADPVKEKGEYDAAFSMLLQRRYADSERAFRQFLASYPTGEYADNAQYWLAESIYVTRDLDSALGEFRKVVQHYPASSKVPSAMLKISFIFNSKQQWTETRAVLEDLIKRYPETTSGKLAMKRLVRMRNEGR